MMRYIILILMFVSVIGCERKLSRSEVEKELKNAFSADLYKNVNYDSARFKYIIQDVSYFEGKDNYECEFRVKLITRGGDTSGVMAATISKDFAAVHRKR